MAVLYALMVGILLTRTPQGSHLRQAMLHAAKVASMVFLVISIASVVAWMLIEVRFPQIVADELTAFSNNPLVFLFILNNFLLLVGCVLEVASAIVMLMPIIAPVAATYGIEPLHLSVVVVLNLTIGLITPTVGTCLFVASGITGLPL